MNLPVPPSGYSSANEAQTRSQIEIEDARNHKKFTDLEVGKDCRVIFTDTVTGLRYPLVVTSGVLTLGAAL